MLISLPLRLPAHVLDFGYLFDAKSGEPQRQLGRGTLRISANFPESCTAHALPGRLATHVSELKNALDSNTGNQRALLILPSYEDGNCELIGGHVTLQRIVLCPEFESVERPGDSTRTSAMVFDWSSFSRHAANIVANADRLLKAEAIDDDVPPMQRFQIPRPTIELRRRSARCIGDLSSLALSMLAGIIHGDCVRLGAGDCAEEACFLSAFADVLEILPESLRGHVSAATGVTLPDPAVQIAWSRCLTSNAREASIGQLFGAAAPATMLTEAGRMLFSGNSVPPFRHSGTDPEMRYAGELISTRTNAGVMPQVRHFVSHAVATEESSVVGSAAARQDYTGAAQVIADLVASEAAPARREALIRFVIKASAQERAMLARECTGQSDAVVATVAQMLCGETWDVIDLQGLAASLILAQDAESNPDTRDFAVALALRVRRELTAFLRGKLLLTEPMLRSLVASDALSAMTAKILTEEDKSIGERLFDSVAVIELLGPEGQALAVSVRQRLAPRDARTSSFRANRISDAGALARALSLLISAERLEFRNVKQQSLALASRLVMHGRRDLVIDAMRGISNRLSLCETPDDRAGMLVEQRRLDVLISLAKVLRGVFDIDSSVSDENISSMKVARLRRSDGN